MGLWTGRALPWLTDVALRGAAVDALRQDVCRGLRGRVLEIGFGAGPNLAFLPGEVTSVAAVEPSDEAWRLSAARRERAGIPVERLGADAQELPPDAVGFDAVLVTFSLCSVPDPARALAEVRRVLRPGGRLHLLEHGLSPDPRVARWQHRLEPVQRRVAGGCHLTRDVPALLSAAGFRADHLAQGYLLGSAATRPWAYGYRGSVGTA